MVWMPLERRRHRGVETRGGGKGKVKWSRGRRGRRREGWTGLFIFGFGVLPAQGFYIFVLLGYLMIPSATSPLPTQPTLRTSYVLRFAVGLSS